MKTLRYSVGDRVGSLTLLERILPTKAGEHTKWFCRCDCEAHIVVDNSNLRKQRQCKNCASAKSITHGMSNTALYTVWGHMKQRCLNPQNQSYPDYGGRGIRLCPEWLAFDPFMEWSLSHGYSTDLTLDRIDNDGDYCPQNCRWVDRKTQQNNRRNSIYITAYGETRPCAEWARITGIPKNTIRGRLKTGWSGERAVSEAVK